MTQVTTTKPRAPKGCSFSTRCTMVVARCHVERPIERIMGGNRVRCHRAEELGAERLGPAQRHCHIKQVEGDSAS
jgi:hypothetical protein